jgi:tripartite-type tricarboxylate transporter receptor subunit TctC
MKLPRRALLHLAAGIIALLPLAGSASAQPYPTRPIHFIMPFPAAGPADILARLYADRLSQMWNQPVVVENRPGATGSIGTEFVVRAPPDGYTLLFSVDLPITMAPALLKVPYDPQRDLIPIASVAKGENVLVVNPSAGIHSIADLVAAAKAKPGRLTFSSAGSGSPAQLCGEMIKRQTGIDMTHVPYAGAAPAMNGVLAGEVTMFCGPMQLALPQVKAGTVVALGVTGSTPSALLPGVPPLAASYPGLVIENWFALFAPAGTDAAVTRRLNDGLTKIFADSSLQSKLAPLGLDAEWTSSAEVTKRVASDIVKWRDFVAAAHIRAD